MAIDIIHSAVGWSEAEARILLGKYGLTTRVLRRDSNPYIVTADLRTNRVNIEVDNGVVTKAYRG